jgi:uncharacterized protein
MKFPSINKVGLFAALALISLGAFATDLYDSDGIPLKPNPPKLVNLIPADLPYGNPSTLAEIERSLRAFSDTTSNQIVLVITNSLKGYEPNYFATEIGQRWGVGQSKFDNGIVILLVPKELSDDRRGHVYIATGYGLEGVVPDAIAKRIVQYEMIPEFKKGNYDAGLLAAVKVLKELSLKEYNSKEYLAKHKKKKVGWGIVPLFFLFGFFVIFIINRAQKNQYTPGSDVPFWTALFLASAAGRSHGGSWNHFSGGTGSFGGGFGGFGGGGFGGGGAGGSW